VALLDLEAYPPIPPLDNYDLGIVRVWPYLFDHLTVLRIESAEVFLLDCSSQEVQTVLVFTTLALAPCINSSYLPNPRSAVVVEPRDRCVGFNVGKHSKLLGKKRADGEPGREVAQRPIAVVLVEAQWRRWCSLTFLGSRATLNLFLVGDRYGVIVACMFRHVHSSLCARGLVRWQNGFLRNGRSYTGKDGDKSLGEGSHVYLTSAKRIRTYSQAMLVSTAPLRLCRDAA